MNSLSVSVCVVVLTAGMAANVAKYRQLSGALKVEKQYEAMVLREREALRKACLQRQRMARKRGYTEAEIERLSYESVYKGEYHGEI